MPGATSMSISSRSRRSGPTRASGAASAWKSKPTFYLVASDDHMIPPPAQRAMAERAGATVAETAASHSVYVSKAAETAALISRAADQVAEQTVIPTVVLA